MVEVHISRRKVDIEAQHITRGTSFKFVPEPSIEEIQSNLLTGLKRFDNAVRVWHFNKTRKQPPPPIISDDTQQTKRNGLNTKLRPTNGNTQHKGYLPVSENVEAFLYELRTELLDVLF